MKNVPHIKVRNPLLENRPRYKKFIRYVYEGGKLMEYNSAMRAREEKKRVAKESS